MEQRGRGSTSMLLMCCKMPSQGTRVSSSRACEAVAAYGGLTGSAYNQHSPSATHEMVIRSFGAYLPSTIKIVVENSPWIMGKKVQWSKKQFCTAKKWPKLQWHATFLIMHVAALCNVRHCLTHRQQATPQSRFQADLCLGLKPAEIMM